MFAQVHLSAQLSLVNFHVYYLSYNMSARLRSIAQKKIFSSVAFICSTADKHLGCNQSNPTAICKHSAQLKHKSSWGCNPQNLSSAASTSRVAHDQLLCNLRALGAICQLSKSIVSSAAMLELKCNLSLCPLNNSFWLKSVISDANNVCPEMLLSRGNLAQLQSETGFYV